MKRLTSPCIRDNPPWCGSALSVQRCLAEVISVGASDKQFYTFCFTISNHLLNALPNHWQQVFNLTAVNHFAATP
jgi:hypothetical protein